MSEFGYSNALSAGLGGVLVKGSIERLALISLTDIARLNWREGNDIDEEKTMRRDAMFSHLPPLPKLTRARPVAIGSVQVASW